MITTTTGPTSVPAAGTLSAALIDANAAATDNARINAKINNSHRLSRHRLHIDGWTEEIAKHGS